MTPEEQNHLKWITFKYGQMSLQAESLLEEVTALRTENAKLKKALAPEKEE